ncbi:MAG: radical SAM protein [Bacteroidetes bacterium]|nr:radical SAM protein [Bacteroidota bacterium]
MYCLPQPEHSINGIKGECISHGSDQMTANEIISLAKIFIQEGVKKIRITGGEPLVRKDASMIIRELGMTGTKLVITTNGSRIHHFMDVFKEAGINSINVSLDSLNRDLFHKLTQRDDFIQVKNNIRLLLDQNFHVKINMVVMNGYNENELADFVEWTKDAPVHVRFIEFMPFPEINGNPTV